MRRDLGRLTDREHDLLVVGGGIHGAAIARDAAERGLATALVEADDFGSGTSWNSLKTIHGGLRYLQKADLLRMRESIVERSTLLRIAPDLVRPLSFVIPTYGHGTKGPEAMALGLLLNEVISFDRNRGLSAASSIPRARTLSRREMAALVPGAPSAGLTGGAAWTDAQVASSERLGIAFVLAGVEAGLEAANHVEARAVLLRDGRAVGVRARDLLSGSELEVRARLTLLAAGPGLDRLLVTAGVRHDPVPMLRAMNLVLRRPVVSTHAVGAPISGRYLFLVPWQGIAIGGTSYEPAESPGGREAEERLLADLAQAFPWAALTPDDVALVHRGFVPGVRDASGLWSRHRLADHARDGVPGLLSLVGVKYTTARGVAEQCVDLAVRRLGRVAGPCRTAERALPNARRLEGPLAERASWAVREEAALTLRDAILRRLDLGTAGPPPGAEVEIVLDAMAADLGWSPDRRARERDALALSYAATPTGQTV
jgi:glycerol-3-phosphate dehydrogenase